MLAKSVRLFKGNTADKGYERTNHSKHVREDRQERIKQIYKVDKNGIIDRAFIVDKNHRNGLELHAVSKNGVIYVYNLESKILVTEFIANPYRISRLYQYCNLIAPSALLDRARKNYNLYGKPSK